MKEFVLAANPVEKMKEPVIKMINVKKVQSVELTIVLRHFPIAVINHAEEIVVVQRIIFVE